MPLSRRCNNLREIRIQKGLSGYDLQILSHISAQSIYMIERGLKRPQRYEKHILSETLSVQEEELFPCDLEDSSKIENTESNGRRQCHVGC